MLREQGRRCGDFIVTRTRVFSVGGPREVYIYCTGLVVGGVPVTLLDTAGIANKAHDVCVPCTCTGLVVGGVPVTLLDTAGTREQST